MSGENTSMPVKLYVGGLPYATTDEELKTAFEKAGSVTSSVIIIDRMTNRSRGFGFIEMATQEEADKAIEMWNGNEYGGRKLIVNIARPMEERPRRDDRGGSYQRRDDDRGGNRW